MIGALLAAAFRRRRHRAVPVRLLVVGEADAPLEAPELEPGERSAARGGSTRGFGAAVARPREVRFLARR